MFTRRRFAFWLGMGLFWLADRLRADTIDALAATLMRATDTGEPSQREGAPRPASTEERWDRAENDTWRWYQRETRVDGTWTRSGITMPLHKVTGQPYTDRPGTRYLDANLVPDDVRLAYEPFEVDESKFAADGPNEGQPDATRRAREGRPPSQWLRSLKADELRIWLKTIEVPYCGVGGMTFRTHLTRDHAFGPENIDGLTVFEQAKLHSAAHYGY
jgi:hypothetical protein